MKFEQDLVPRSVNPSLNLSTNKILFFAGGAGDWAYCFAQNGISVHFTDSSSEIIRKVKKKFPNSFTEIEVSDAIKLPKHKTDELMISFEPTPLYGGPLLFFLPRALALSKGVIIIQRQNLSPSPINEISIISRLYSLKVEFGLCSFICKYREEKRYKKRWLLFYRLVANEKMKKLLKADFQKFSKLTGNPKSSTDLKKHLNDATLKVKGKNDRVSKLIRFAAKISDSSGRSPSHLVSPHFNHLPLLDTKRTRNRASERPSVSSAQKS